MAKFGYLYLHDGKWGGYRVIPDDWVKKSIQQKVSIIEHTPSHTQRNYGYLWWLRNKYDAVGHTPVEYDMYSAIGSGGQRIVVIPKQNMIVVFTANNKDSFFADPIIDNSILTSIKSNKPLPPNPKGDSLLLSKEQAFKLEHDLM
jgi:CubicO group peptidase (beta-lactamase class C family)